ncbi:MAG: glutamate--tRNA ligase family protein [Phycisphaerales bacterium]
MSNRTTRLAPSPTGALHLGNARTFLITWAMARKFGWRLEMRIEDLDGPRVKLAAAQQALDLFAWLGIDYDGEPTYQSADLDPYRAAMDILAARGMVYQCTLSRGQIEQASAAPHRDERELRFPSELRPTDPRMFVFDEQETNYRFIVGDESIRIDDEFAGRSVFRPLDEVGDFVVWTKRATPSYQLAVTVDDARQGITDVVRGDDLLPSAARQTLLYGALDLQLPKWWHLPLVVGPDGRRLAKRHGDTRLTAYREAGVSASRIIGLLASWSGIGDKPTELTAEEFKDGLILDGLDRGPVVFRREDHRWLLDGA